MSEIVKCIIKSIKEYIEYIHIHSNDGKYDKDELPSTDEIFELNSLLGKYNKTLYYLLNTW